MTVAANSWSNATEINPEFVPLKTMQQIRRLQCVQQVLGHYLPSLVI